MIDLSRGPVHISAGPSANSNSMCLTIISRTLRNRGRVIWMTRELSHNEKLLDILGHHSENEMNRMMIVEFGNNISGKMEPIKRMIPSLRGEDLLIVEEWCESYGRAKKSDCTLMQELAGLNKKTRIIITSNSYEDASGKKRGLNGWMVRGEKSLGSIFRTVWLTKIEEQYQKVMITDGDEQTIVHLTKKGFEKKN
ncbi:TPA: hypothetical protein HA324_04540 [Candidatus Thalassarchaeaceae archaeon]|nr:hypothetical protein [Euryarchaeota archaeon]DAC63142.1 MAG TPA: hypothetical protein D7I04_03475 [Candidatus Poseidoniales archaeon]DAC66291.1 MAG TPA: hypothetical protein D7I14_04505 [Candidatus Poseidoniales archaeon]HIH06293.1 hypothetical protein [Candidatus Thalassarchaeaceae archaeon]HII42419.1 hypothetical protein [Candidatus Thalassarchaeaceae archaeon]